MASLIQQRLAIERIRVRALWIVCVSAGMFVLGGALVLSGTTNPFSIPPLVIWAGGIVTGIVEMRRYRRALREFEAEHGVGAGDQTSGTDS